jgi:hypothetical protein
MEDGSAISIVTPIKTGFFGYEKYEILDDSYIWVIFEDLKDTELIVWQCIKGCVSGQRGSGFIDEIYEDEPDVQSFDINHYGVETTAFVSKDQHFFMQLPSSFHENGWYGD